MSYFCFVKRLDKLPTTVLGTTSNLFTTSKKSVNGATITTNPKGGMRKEEEIAFQ